MHNKFNTCSPDIINGLTVGFCFILRDFGRSKDCLLDHLDVLVVSAE